MPPEFVIPLAIGIAALVIISIIFGIVYDKKRREGMQKFASELGLEFYKDLPVSDVSEFSGFQLAHRGSGQRSRNGIIADSGELRMVFFDFQYTTGGGKNSKTKHQTVMMATSKTSLQLPDFTLSPESFLNRLGDVFGFKDIDFDDDEEFSDAFLLHGSDEEFIRAFFNPVRRKKFFEFRDVSMEARGDAFIFYKPGVRIRTNELRSLMERAFSLYSLLSSEA